MYVGIPKLRSLEEIERERFEEFVQKRIKQEARRKRNVAIAMAKKNSIKSSTSDESTLSNSSIISRSWDKIARLFGKSKNQASNN